MNALQIFLREHARTHAAVELLDGLPEPEVRAPVAGFNSLAWIVWHMARIEDGCLATWVFGTEQEFDVGEWGPRLRAGTRANGFGMRGDEVAALSAAVDLGALRTYREAVGRRTAALAAGLWPGGWSEPLTEADAQRAASSGEACRAQVGEPREALLWWWGVQHNIWHIGQCAAIRSRLR